MNSHKVMTGVLGFPLGHSMSPAMHNAAFEALRLNYQYDAIPVPPSELQHAVNRIRELGFRGVNVTIPHKVSVMEMLDELDQSALDIGAVNTIVNDNGKLIGYNTDGSGYIQSLMEELDVNVSGLAALIIGAGGVARAVTAALARAGVKRMYIFDRQPDYAKQLAEQLSPIVKTEAVAYESIGELLAGINLLINASPVGMYPNATEIPLDPSLLHSGLIVSDVIYNPYETALLSEAKKIGARVHHGAGMFIHQGVLAFELFTGQPAPVNVMRSIVEQHLNLEVKA